MITIFPDQIHVLPKQRQKSFKLIISEQFINLFEIGETKIYKNCEIIPSNQFYDIDEIVKSITESDIFILPYGIYHRAIPKQNSINKSVKVLNVLCTSTYTTLEELQHFIDSLYKDIYKQQEQFAKRYFDIIANHGDKNLKIDNKMHKIKANLVIDESIRFSEQYGYAKIGSQTIVPNGEIAMHHPNTLQDTNGFSSCMNINGEIVLDGIPIIHKNGPEPYVNKDVVDNLYFHLKDLAINPVVLKIDKGIIVECKALNAHSNLAIEILKSLFMVDERYKIISEVGCAFNTSFELYDSNCSLNETFGGKHGCVHFGIGSRNTCLHIDFLAPGTSISTQNHCIIGSSGRQ